MTVRDRVLVMMVGLAELQDDGTGKYRGSPRPLMEGVATSNGYLYQQLRSLGLVQEGRGSSAVWTIPRNIMELYGSMS